jgi:probable F420-dependent oxidoreductase
MMKFGIILPSYGPSSSPDGILATAQYAERLGFDSAWTTDHVLLPHADAARFGTLYEALLTLGWIAGATTHLLLGVSSLVLPQRNPVIVAKQVATLDALSGGRAILCIGVGWSAGEFANLGQRFEDRGRRMDEAIQVLRSLWGSQPEEPITFRGEYYQFEEAVFSPPPVQSDGPTLWIGGRAEAALRRAALLSEGWHASRVTLEEFMQSVRHIRELAPNRKVTISARLRLSLDDTDLTAPLQGPPAKISETLSAYQSAGLEYAIIDFRCRNQKAIEDAMACFVDDVLPAFSEEAL